MMVKVINTEESVCVCGLEKERETTRVGKEGKRNERSRTGIDKSH